MAGYNGTWLRAPFIIIFGVTGYMRVNRFGGSPIKSVGGDQGSPTLGRWWWWTSFPFLFECVKQFNCDRTPPPFSLYRHRCCCWYRNLNFRWQRVTRVSETRRFRLRNSSPRFPVGRPRRAISQRVNYLVYFRHYARLTSDKVIKRTSGDMTTGCCTLLRRSSRISDNGRERGESATTVLSPLQIKIPQIRPVFPDTNEYIYNKQQTKDNNAAAKDLKQIRFCVKDNIDTVTQITNTINFYK